MDKTASPNPATTTISLNDVGDRYLNHYQKLFDILIFSLSSFRKSSEQDYDEFTQQVMVMPKNQVRMSFDRAKETSEQWLFKHVMAEAAASIVSMLEDCRTICALCDYKVANKNNPADLQAITGPTRQEFLGKSLEDKFTFLQTKYALSSDLQEHVTSIIEAARALLNRDGFMNSDTESKDLQVKIRTLTLVQTTPQTAAGEEPTLSLARRMGEATRTFKPGEKIIFSKAEQIGTLITLSLFLASMLQGVQAYAKKTGAAS